MATGLNRPNGELLALLRGLSDRIARLERPRLLRLGAAGRSDGAFDGYGWTVRVNPQTGDLEAVSTATAASPSVTIIIASRA